MVQLRQLLIGFCFCWCAWAQALTIEITQGVTQARPISMSPFLVTDSRGFGIDDIPVAVDQVIQSDLSNSGYFSFLRASGAGSTPSKIQTLDLLPWLQIGSENVITGKVERISRDKYQVEFVLFDVFKAFAPDGKSTAQGVGGPPGAQAAANPVLLYQKYDNISGAQLRSLAHHMSDLIFEKLLGIRGAFSTRIAYIMVPDGKQRRHQLVVADADGYNAHVLMDSKEPLMSPSWSPDARKLAFVSFERFRAEIYMIDSVTGRRERVSAFPGINGAPTWTPDGSKLALVLSKGGSPNIYLYDLGTKKLDQLTTGFSIDTEPSFSADGRRMLFTSNKGGTPQIYEMNLATKNIKRVTFDGGYNARASYTPDGKKIVMIHRDEGGTYRIALQDLASGEINLLTNARLDESPSIAPNGTMVLYGTQVSDKRILGAVSVDGRIKLRLPSNEGSVQEPAWSPFSN
jgi:TolB protein